MPQRLTKGTEVVTLNPITYRSLDGEVHTIEARTVASIDRVVVPGPRGRVAIHFDFVDGLMLGASFIVARWVIAPRDGRFGRYLTEEA